MYTHLESRYVVGVMQYGASPLYMGVQEGRLEVVKALLERPNLQVNQTTRVCQLVSYPVFDVIPHR